MKKGIQKLADFYNDDVKTLDSRITELKDAAKNYTTFTGAADGVKSTVKFILQDGQYRRHFRYGQKKQQ